jgi:serine/threonine protein kinase
VAVNASEQLAIEKLKNKLQGLRGPWVLISNLNHSSSAVRLSDEIDLVAIGPTGIFVIEIKHWDSAFLKQRADIAEAEAERINDKSKRIAGKLRTGIDPGFVAPRLLLTRGGTGLQGGQRIRARGVPVFGLTEWKELIDAEGVDALDPDRIERAVHLLLPASRVALTGDLRTFAGFINLERTSPATDAFHRIYRGQHPTRRDKVVLHLYDLSAADDKDAETRARREFEVMQHWQKSPFLPNLLDSFQEAEHYPGELYYFSLVDPAAPDLAERARDPSWAFDDRLRFARESLLALAEFHHPSDEGMPSIVHRHITPLNLRVRHNGKPLFTDFSLARLADAQTISAAKTTTEGDQRYIAPEVLRGGIAAADARSDVFSICASLMSIFSSDGPKTREAREFLSEGCVTNPEGRASLVDLADVLNRNTSAPASTTHVLPPAEYWDEDTLVTFRNACYKIVGRLGRGGIGQTFKVVQVDAQSEELYGTYVGKVITHEADAESALRAYRKARSHTVHPHLSAIHEIAHEWQANAFVALLKWIEGMPLSDLSGVLPIHAEELGELSPQAMVLRWLSDLCDALWQLHRVGLVHGDVSPRNIIVHGGEVVLTDYDTVADVGSVPRSRNHIFASFDVESGLGIRPSDDLFALSASLFQVLFDREPFAFGAERQKNRGCNWENLPTEGLEMVVAFLKRATSPVASDRFDDARAALTYLARTGRPGEQTTVHEAAPVLAANIAPRLAELLSAYPGSRHGNSETRGLDSAFAVATYVETRLDAALREEIEGGQVALAILFGNAGDGKTAFLQHLLLELGSPTAHSSHRVLERRLSDGRTLYVNLDGSAAWQGKTANQLLDSFFKPFQTVELDRLVRQPRILAINSGKLLEWLETQDETPLTEQLYRALFGDEDDGEKVLDSRIRLIDLNRRSLVGGVEGGQIKAGFLEALLDRFLGTGLSVDPWTPCATCTAQHRCTAWHSVRSLRDAAVGARLRLRLTDVLQASHLRGEIHITARELRAALAYVFFGTHDCTELHSDPEITPPFYWDRVFDADAVHRQGELLGELARFDPALDSNPLLDRQLLKEAPHGASDIAVVLASARRRAWFEWDDARYEALHLSADALSLYGGRQLGKFRRVPLMNDGERAALCRDLCLGIARLEDLPDAAFASGSGLPLRIQPRTPTESAFWVVKPWERFSLTAPLPRTAEGLETLHTHLVLLYRYEDGEQERLPIGLELFHLLLALKDGAQLSGASQEGIFAHLEIFTQRLAQEDARELHGWNPARESEVSRVYVEARGARQVVMREALS